MQKSPLSLQFWLLAAIALINSVSFTAIIPLIYPYAKLFGLSDFQASLLTTAYAISQFIGTPILGRLSDFLGRKPLLLVSLMGTVIAGLIASLTPYAWLLYASRVLDGVTGGNVSIARAVISDMISPDHRPRAFGIFDAMFRLGFVAGPSLSYLAQTIPPFPGVSRLGMGFLVAAGMALVATVLTLFFLPETLSTKRNFHLSWRDFGIGRIFKSATRPKIGSLFLLTFFSGFTFTIFTFAFQPFFLNVLQQTPKMLAIVFAMFGILGFVAQVFWLQPLTTRFKLMDILAIAILVRGILFLLIPTFPTLPAFLAIGIFFGIANAYPLPLINSLLSLNSSDREQGEVFGINASYLSMSNAFGPATAGMLVELGYKAPFWITGVLTILTAWFAHRLKTSLEVEAETKPG
ncbi:arabinose efflux permease family protein [Leptolyngbyaceae cyanobacterium JSC-12]|nr:arabinose efflux permease family protein [Leptolyngbyaceae cyanobacterium JSC-12]